MRMLVGKRGQAPVITLRPMITAVTGAAGFIGSAVVRKLLERGRRVRAIVEPGANEENLRGLDVERMECDVTDGKKMFRALEGCASLFHLAAIYKMWTRDPDRMWRVNVEGTEATLLAAMHAKVARIVHTSSTVAVGLVPGAEADESIAFNQHDVAGDYTMTKWQSERVAMRFAEAGLSVVVVNPGLPFGPRDRAPTPTGRIVLSILKGDSPPAVGPGGFGTIDVDDCAEGHVLAEEKGRAGERYILVTGNVSVADFVSRVETIAGIRRRKIYIPGVVGVGVARAMEWWSDRVSHKEPLITSKYARYAQRNPFFSGAKAKRELGLPTRPLDESIRRAIDWFRETEMV